MDYCGKYIHQIDKDNFSILVNRKHLEQLHLLLNFCVDEERLNNTKQVKYFCRELKDEVEDIFGR